MGSIREFGRDLLQALAHDPPYSNYNVRAGIMAALVEINKTLEAGWECDMSGAVETAQTKIATLISEIGKGM